MLCLSRKTPLCRRCSFIVFFTGFVEGALQDIPGHRKRYLAHPYGGSADNPSEPAVIAVGPEGGFIEREVETFINLGFNCFSIGERTLTTEHFVPFILGRLIK